MEYLERYLYPAAAGAAAFALGFSLSWFARRLAWHVGAVDYPGEARRMHDHPIPRAGGIAVYLCFLLLTAVFCDLSPLLAAVWTGGCLLFLTGLIDDVLSLGVGTRLLAQTVASLIAVLGGGLADFTDPLSFGLAVLFPVALVNAHNFVDGIDGLCAKLGATEAIAVSILLFLGSDAGALGDAGIAGNVEALGDTDSALALLILACALLGFLPLGRAPAKLFLGDCGSTPIGFLCGCFALRWVGLVRAGASPVPWLRAALTLAFLFSVPLCDLFLAVVRRLTQGKNPFLPDRGHLHHLLVDSGYSHEDAGTILVTLSALSALIGVSLNVEALLPFASAGCVAAALLLVWVWRRMTVRKTARRLRRRVSGGR